jgi:hypothetical protein
MTEPKHRESERPDVIRITTGSLKLPESVAGDATSKARMNGVVIVVVAIALAFIAFIAWLISTS